MPMMLSNKHAIHNHPVHIHLMLVFVSLALLLLLAKLVVQSPWSLSRPQHVELLQVQQSQSQSQPQPPAHEHIPRIIWAYWDKPALPPVVAAITACWQRLPPGWGIRLVTPASIDTYLPVEVQRPQGLGPEHFADWLRLKLLELYGGVWMDASTLLHDPSWLVQLHTEASNRRVEIAGCHIPNFRTRAEYPVIENYLLLAPAHSPFVQEWLAEYKHAIAMGFDAYRTEIESSGAVDPQNIYKSSGTYLTQHVCAQKVMQGRDRPVESYALLRDANESVFALHGQLGWDANAVAQKAISDAAIQQYPIIKLRGIDRKGISDADAQRIAQLCARPR